MTEPIIQGRFVTQCRLNKSKIVSFSFWFSKWTFFGLTIKEATPLGNLNVDLVLTGIFDSTGLANSDSEEPFLGLG
jgi:hypothetical protein